MLSSKEIKDMEKAARETLEYLHQQTDPSGCHEVLALCEYIKSLTEKNLLLAAAVKWFDGYMDGDMRPTVVLLADDQTNTRAVAEAEELLREMRAEVWDEGKVGLNPNPYRDFPHERSD